MGFFGRRKRGHALGRRYGRAGKRMEGVRVQREKGRLYWVERTGEVASKPMKNA